MLPQRYQRFITHDINRILRELSGPNDKKDSAGLHAPSSPMAAMHPSQGTIAPLTLDTSSPQTLIGGSTTLTRKNSNPDYNGEMELPPKGTFLLSTVDCDSIHSSMYAYVASTLPSIIRLLCGYSYRGAGS